MLTYYIGLIILFTLAALMLAAALYFLQSYMFPEPTLMQQRLQQLKVRQQEEDSLIGDVGAAGFASLFKGSQYANENLGKILSRYSLTAQIHRAIRQAGLKTPVDKFIMTFLVIPIGVGLLFSVLLVNPLPVALGIGYFMLVMLSLKMRLKKRLAQLTAQLPDALNLITSSLRAGHSFQSALNIVVTELPDPLSSEFSQVLSDINWGIPVKDALNKMVANLDNLPDIRMFVTSLIIQREAGGNLAEVLDKLSYTIRERFKLQGQIKALTGQSRLTGYVLGCAPAGLFTFLFIFMNSYIAPMLKSTLGQILLGVALVMQVIGFFVMKKIIEIRV